MGKIGGYEKDTNLTGTETFIGTDIDDESKTKNYLLSEIKDYVAATLGLKLNRTLILSATSITEQVPVALDDPEAVQFAIVASTDSTVSVNAQNIINITTAQSLDLEIRLNLTKALNSPISVFYVAVILNGSPVAPYKVFEMTKEQTIMNVTELVSIDAAALDQVYVSIMLDAVNTPTASLKVTSPAGAGIPDIPSADLKIYRKTISQ